MSAVRTTVQAVGDLVIWAPPSGRTVRQGSARMPLGANDLWLVAFPLDEDQAGGLRGPYRAWIRGCELIVMVPADEKGGESL